MIGKYIKQPEGFKALTLYPFPNKELLKFSHEIIKKNSRASLLLGKLDGITHLLPDVDFFISMYIHKDASSSSQIEGTKATMMDALQSEIKIESDIPEDVDDILHYIKALNYGIKRLGNFPLSNRFICELHGKLMDNARNTHFCDPGNFRKTQNWIGGKSPSEADFVPPNVHDMKKSLQDLEKFFHDNLAIPPLIKAALIHSQFETIHPFLDGNGRTGRLLITLFLLHEKLLEKPVLFLSSYFKKYKSVYYETLNKYHNNNPEKWLLFFLDGIIETSEVAIKTVKEITILREDDLFKISKFNKKSSESGLLVLKKLFANPIVSVSTIQEWTGFSTQTGAKKLIDRFIEAGILEIKDQNVKYGKTYIYKKYLYIFENIFR